MSGAGPSPSPSTTPLRRAVAILLLLLCSLAIFGGSSGRAPSAIVELGIPDYILHAAEYAVLGFLAARAALHLTLRTGWIVLVLVPGALATLYGASDELHQAFVPGREPDLRDLFADGVGGFAGAVVYRCVLLFLLARARSGAAVGTGAAPRP